MSGPDFVPEYRHDATVYPVPPFFYKVVKALRKSMREGAWISSDPSNFRAVMKGADPVLDAKEKAGGFQRLLERVGALIEDAAEGRYYVDEQRLELLTNEARLHDKLPRATCAPAERLAILKKALDDRKEAERLSAAASNGNGAHHADPNALSLADANVMVGLLEEENEGLNKALEAVKTEREQLKLENTALANAFKRVETSSTVLTEAREKQEEAEEKLSSATTRFATDSAMKAREIEGLEQSLGLLSGKHSEAERKLAAEKARADQLQQKLDRLKPELIDSARKGIGDLGTLLRLIANESNVSIQTPQTPAPKAPSQPPVIASTKGVKIEEIEGQIVKRAEFSQRVMDLGLEIQDEIATLKNERKDAEAAHRSGTTQEERVEGQINFKRINSEIEVFEKYYSELMSLRRPVDDEVKRLIEFVDASKKLENGPPALNSLPGIPKRPESDTAFVRVDPAVAQRFKSRLVEIAQKQSCGQRLVMIATLYEISPKTNGGRAICTVQRLLRSLSLCGLMHMGEQVMEQTYKDFCDENSREKRPERQLLKSQSMPNNGIPLYSRTATALPWKADDLVTPDMKEAYLKAFELVGTLNNN